LRQAWHWLVRKLIGRWVRVTIKPDDAAAMLAARDYVIPDDVKRVAVAALAHRITLRPELWVRQVKSDDVIGTLLSNVPVPRTDPVAVIG